MLVKGRPGYVLELRDVIEDVIGVLADAEVVGPTEVVGGITVVVVVVIGGIVGNNSGEVVGVEIEVVVVIVMVGVMVIEMVVVGTVVVGVTVDGMDVVGTLDVVVVIVGEADVEEGDGGGEGSNRGVEGRRGRGVDSEGVDAMVDDEDIGVDDLKMAL